jgi:HAD superfamily hydrolase (TIGR01509 family)
MAKRKPEPKAYKIVLDYLQCKPSEAIFLDDNIDNITGAKKIGIATIWVTSQETMRTELEKFGCL